MEIERLPISAIALNEGQIEGLPTNPRQWTQADIDRIARSLQETPELFQMRPCIVKRQGEQYVLLAGNLRYCGARQNGDTDVPCIVVPDAMPVAKLKEIVLKDNGSFGAWDFDALANEWGDLPLTEWGVSSWEDIDIEGEMKETEKLSGLEYNSMYFEPKEQPAIKLSDCIDTTKYDEKIKALQGIGLTEEQLERLKVFAYRFIKIDFEAVATYYAFCADEKEKLAMERLRLVLIDDGVNGFIEDDLLRVLYTLKDE